jgi:hypothetical protein
MPATSSTVQPSWQDHPVFRFFASLKLAVVLLAVLIVGAIAGTIYESSFDAKVARAYVYGAPWFNLWLVFLASNLTVSALSRWPWKKYHIAFLITHLGIITLLTGSLIGRIWGIEGTITLFKGEPPTNRLLVDQHQLRVRDTDGIIKSYPAEFIHRPPTPGGKPRDLGSLVSGARLSMVDYAPAVEAKLNPKPLNDGGVAALQFHIATAMMRQRLESWLLADDPQHGSFGMGLANIELKRGVAPAGAAADSPNESKSSGEVDIEESIFAFAKAPEEQIAKVAKGGSTGAKVQLSQPQNGNKGSVVINISGKNWTFDVAQNLGKDAPLNGSPFRLRVENYWPDFRITDGKPATLTEQPNNPAVVVTLRGKAVPAATAPNSHGATSGSAPEMPAGDAEPSANRLTLFVADDGAITYDLTSRKLGRSTGKLELNKPLPTGWADWQLSVDKLMPHAAQWMDFNPVAAAPTASDLPDGVRVRIRQGGQTFEQWAAAGWQISIPTSPTEVQIAYGWKQLPLPIGLELLDFEVQRNEGNDSPAAFKSTLRITNAEGDTSTGQCWMNNPFSYPAAWWRTWTGLTFKMSQASWNPDNLGQSTIQILRDPGWSLKWIGSLLIVAGVFMMFYLSGYRKGTAAAPPIAPSVPFSRKKRREAELTSAGH